MRKPEQKNRKRNTWVSSESVFTLKTWLLFIISIIQYLNNWLNMFWLKVKKERIGSRFFFLKGLYHVFYPWNLALILWMSFSCSICFFRASFNCSAPSFLSSVDLLQEFKCSHYNYVLLFICQHDASWYRVPFICKYLWYEFLGAVPG